MKKLLTFISVILFAGVIYGQEEIVNSFDAASATNPNYWLFFNQAADDSTVSFIKTSFDSTGQKDGAGAFVMEYSAQNTATWGGFVKLEHWTDDSTGVYDWSKWDTLSIWYRNVVPETQSGRVHFRLNLHDVSDSPRGDSTYGVDNVEYMYSFHYVLDDSSNTWTRIDIPLVNNQNWDGDGFNRTGWAGISGNDFLDKDKIKGWSFEFSINGSGNGDYVSGTFEVDKMYLHGVAPNPWLIFNGKTVNSSLGAFTWGQSSLELVEGGGEDPATNAVLWTQGDEWSNGWSGAGWNVSPPMDLESRWDMDSIRVNMKTDAGVGTIRLQMESGADGAFGWNITPIDDGNWHKYAVALKDAFVVDGKANFNKAAITVFQVMGEGNAQAGKKVYFDYIWTGDPVIDVVAPEAPGLVTAAGGSYVNLVTWSDVAGESGENYAVYYSMNPISDVTAAGVHFLSNIGEGVQVAEHILLAPKTDKSLTYYYAVVCTDASGNTGAVGAASAPVTNDARGVTVINSTAPAGFAADGDLKEWTFAPFRMNPDDGSGFVVTNQTVDDSTDLNVKSWVAVDDQALYVAFDIDDDVNIIDTTATSYLIDSPDLFIGLYDMVNETHSGYKRGAAPDYHLRFLLNGILSDNPGAGMFIRPGANYSFTEKFGSGYIIEAKILWTELAAAGSDNLFTPVVGMQLPIDYSINDADNTAGTREGILTYSPKNEDQSWADVSRWFVTWIGDQMGVVGVDDDDTMPLTYKLENNYPNPFNPTTKIKYSIKEQTNVVLRVFNVLGQEVKTLVNQVQAPGVYEMNFDASELTSGVYIYQIQAGKFLETKKMMLLK